MVAWDLNELRHTDVPFRQAFKLTENTPVCFHLRRMHTKYNEIERKEIDAMLVAWIIKPASSSWGFPAVIAKKKKGRRRFWVYFQTLNERMKADKFPLRKIEEIVDDMVGSKIFSKLDIFAGYWQIELAESVWEQTAFCWEFEFFCLKWSHLDFWIHRLPYKGWRKLFSKILILYKCILTTLSLVPGASTNIPTIILLVVTE